MAMRKTNKSEGKIEVLRGRKAEVLNEHFAKTGKYTVSEFSDEEREHLDADLNQVDSDENPENTSTLYADQEAEDRANESKGGEE